MFGTCCVVSKSTTEILESICFPPEIQSELKGLILDLDAFLAICVCQKDIFLM